MNVSVEKLEHCVELYDNSFKSFMFRKILIFIPLAFFLHENCFAWSWKDAVNQALIKNPELQSRKQLAEIAELTKQNAKVPYFPIVRLTGGIREYQDYTESFRRQIFLGPTIDYLIYQGGKVHSGVDVATERDRQSELNIQISSISVNVRLREAFAGAAYAKRYLDLTRRIENQRKENVKFTKIKYESGLEYKWVYLSSEAKRRQAELDYLKAEMNTKTSLADLEVLLGPLSIQSVEELQDDDFYNLDQDYNLDQLVQSIGENPKFKLQQSEVQEAEANVDFSSADMYPRIIGSGNIGVMSTDRNDLFPYWLVGASLSMPISEGKRYRRNVSIAKAMVEQRKYDFELAKLQIKADLKKAYQNYVIARQQVEVSRVTVEANKDRSRVVANQYRSGLATFLEWESSQDTWVNSEVELLNNTRNYYIQRARLEEAMGTELKEVL